MQKKKLLLFAESNNEILEFVVSHGPLNHCHKDINLKDFEIDALNTEENSK